MRLLFRISCIIFFLFPFFSFIDMLILTKVHHTRRCPLWRQKRTISRTFRTSKCTLIQLKKRSTELQEKSIETLIQEEINLLKFILNSDEIFILCELISIYINRKEFDEIIKKNRVLIITTFIQIFLKRFFIPLLLKHELYTLHQLFQK